MANGDAVGAVRQRHRLAAIRPAEERPPLHDRQEVLIRLRGRVVVQPTPALAAAQVHHDDAVRPVARGVGNVRDADRALPKVEPDVVEVRRLERDLGREGDRFEDFVRREIDPDEFRSTGNDRPELDAAGVEDPETIGWVHNHALHRHERFRWAGLVVGGELGARVGGRLPVLQLDDGERDRVAPPRVTDKDPALVRDGHAGRHRAVEGGDEFERADRLVRREPRLGGEGSGGRSQQTEEKRFHGEISW